MSHKRWLHIRHPDGFPPERFEQFRAHCSVMQAYVKSLLANWIEIGAGTQPAPYYIFYEPELSEDRKIATLPLGGEWTIGSRAIIENECSKMLWQFMPISFTINLEEGLTEYLPEDLNFPEKQHLYTHWRKALKESS